MGSLGRYFLQTTATPSEMNAIIQDRQSVCQTFSYSAIPKSTMSSGRGKSMPRALSTWDSATRLAAPAMNPTITEWETKSTSAPRRATPSASWKMPTRKVRVIAAWIHCPVPGSNAPDRAPNTSADMAVVGPEMTCQDEPNRAATTGVIIAE